MAAANLDSGVSSFWAVIMHVLQKRSHSSPSEKFSQSMVCNCNDKPQAADSAAAVHTLTLHQTLALVL
jgi:hypothetical protein